MTGEKQGLFSHFFADLFFLYTIVYNNAVRKDPEQRIEKQRKRAISDDKREEDHCTCPGSCTALRGSGRRYLAGSGGKPSAVQDTDRAAESGRWGKNR